MNATALEYTKPTYKEFAELPNVQRLSPEEFAASKFFWYCPTRAFSALIKAATADEHAMACRLGAGGSAWFPVTAFEMYDGTGYALAAVRSSSQVRAYTFAACYHPKKTSTNIGNCLNRIRCDVCGYTEDVDSSG